jgi:predicted lipoprotein
MAKRDFCVIMKGAVDQHSLVYCLEAIIDGAGLERVLFAISEVCTAKAEHVSANWQDEGLAIKWVDLSNRVQNAARRARKEGL